ncbi:MAG: molybdenum cofactor guanylyltransferase [Acidiferrobacter sp.]
MNPVLLPIAGVVLAGGAGRRMGGLDKGFVSWAGEPLVVHALRFMEGLPQVLISANRSLPRYRALGYEVVTDAQADFAGPLMGLCEAWRRVTQPWVACVPVDSPCLPADAIMQLWAARVVGGIVVARSPRGPEPLVCLAQTTLLAHLEAYLGNGGRRAQDWFQGLPQAWWDLTAAEAANCNTPADLR